MGRREGDAAQLRPFVSMSELTFHVPALFLPPLPLPSLLPPSFRKIETSHRGVRRLIRRCSRNNSPSRERGQIVMGLMMCPTSRNFGFVSKYQNLNLNRFFNSSQNYRVTSSVTHGICPFDLHFSLSFLSNLLSPHRVKRHTIHFVSCLLNSLKKFTELSIPVASKC